MVDVDGGDDGEHANNKPPQHQNSNHHQNKCPKLISSNSEPVPVSKYSTENLSSGSGGGSSVTSSLVISTSFRDVQEAGSSGKGGGRGGRSRKIGSSIGRNQLAGLGGSVNVMPMGSSLDFPISERPIDVGWVGGWASDFDILLSDPVGIKAFTVSNSSSNR